MLPRLLGFDAVDGEAWEGCLRRRRGGERAHAHAKVPPEGPPAAEDRVAAPVWARLPEGRDPSGLQGVVVPLPVEEGISLALEDVVHGETRPSKWS